MKVLNVTAQNVMRLKDIDYDMSGDHLILVGGLNDNGKTSLLKAFAMAVLGKSGMDNWPTRPLRDGEDEGFVELKLSGSDMIHQPQGITVRVEFTRRDDGSIKEDIVILDAAGDKAASPRKMLQQLIKTRSIDPLAFGRMKPKEQRDLLLSIIGVDIDEFDSRYEKLFDERTGVNRQVNEKTAQFKGMVHYEGVERVDTAELAAELAAVEERNREADKVHQQAKDADRELVQSQQGLAESLEALEAAKRAVKKKQAEVAAAEEKCKSFDNLPSKLPTDEILAKMSSASEINAKVDANERRETAKGELELITKKADDLTKQLKAIEKEKQDAMKSAKMPIEGLGFSKQHVLWNGRPLSDACKRDQVIVSTMIGIAQEPELKLLLCEHGNDLDNDAIDALDELLKEWDFQMVVELVTRSEADEDRCKVIIADGEIVKAKS